MRFPEGTISVTAAADRLGIHKQTIYRWVASGVLPAKRLGPHVIAVTVEDVDRIGAGMDVQPASEEQPR